MPDTAEVDVTQLILLSDFAKKIGRSVDSVRRYVREGSMNIHKTKVAYLKARQTPGGLATTERWYAEYIDELNTL